MIRHETNIRIRYAETDQMRQVYYGRYFEYFEQARSELMRHLGLPYSQFEEMGFLLPVIEAHATYKKPARYDELIHVTTILREKPVARIRLDYQVHDETKKELIAEGYTVHGFINAHTGKPTRAPELFLEVLEKAMSRAGGHGSR
jgi:acyl-CoA thioester hydrolase